jgi:hypothetical protein
MQCSARLCNRSAVLAVHSRTSVPDRMLDRHPRGRPCGTLCDLPEAELPTTHQNSTRSILLRVGPSIRLGLVSR